MWHALLVKASQPLRGQNPLAAPPVWAFPGEATAIPCAIHPHGRVIQAVLSRYAAMLDIPMSFRTAADRYSRPAAGNGVHFHAFALPTPPVLFGAWPRVPLVDLPLAHGIPLLEGTHRALSPGAQFGRGRPLVDADGHVVGEYLGTNLYCLFDLLGQETAWVPLLLRRHLDLGLPHLFPVLATQGGTPSPQVEERLGLLRDETETLARTCRLACRQDDRKTYVSACQDRVTEEIRFLQAEIAFLEDGVEEMARRIAADTRCLKEGHRRLHLLQGCRDQPESGGRELERLQALPHICEARVQDGRISLTTAPILVEFGGRWYRLGSFRLDLHFNGDVRIVNLTDRIGLYDHPHIRQGRPCLGNIREGVAKLLGEFQFVAATEVLIDFLKTVSPADWRLPILHWPEAGREAGRGALAAT
jgi:hypothetical protein